MNQESAQLVLDDARFRMSFPGKIFARAISAASWVIVSALAIFFLLSSSSVLAWTGVLLCLFVFDRALHAGRADKSLTELSPRGRVNVAEFLTPIAFRVLERAEERSRLGRTSFTLEILTELLKNPPIQEVFSRLDVSYKDFAGKTKELLVAGENTDAFGETENLARRALIRALKSGSRDIGVLDVFGALGETENRDLTKLLAVFSLKPQDFTRGATMGAAMRKLPFWRSVPGTLSSFALTGRTRHRVVNRAWTSRPTPALDRFGLDLTDLARAGHTGFMVGHEAEYRRLLETVSRQINPNALLVGVSGSGRETILAHLAYNLVKDEVPAPIFDKRLVSLDVGLLVASASQEELQARLQRLVQEIEIAGNIILYIPNIHNLTKTSGTAYVSAADAFLPILMNNAFPVIGTTFPQEMKQIIEARSDFAALFEVIQVAEVSEDEAITILTYESLVLERLLGIKISLGAIEKSVELAHKYFREKLLPASAEELLKSAAARVKESGKNWLRHEDVLQVAGEKTNVPLEEAGEEETSELLHLEDKIHERLVDQEEAVKAVSDALREYRSGLARKGGPIASFLFVGPTGVGKTELAKILSGVEFGEESQMLRFDMTEYQDKQSFMRFVGSPDGNIPGALTDAVREKPFSLVLLDEFEKAYPDILNLFLQVLDDGRLTDNRGRLIDFQNTIIIATTNARSEFIAQSLQAGKSVPDISEEIKRELIGPFKPELLNRFSKIIVFKSLAPDELLKIAELNLKSLQELVHEEGIELSFSPDAVRKIAELGYDPAFGARPLRRVIEEKIKAPLSEAILKKEIVKGGEAVVSWENGAFRVLPNDTAGKTP